MLSTPRALERWLVTTQEMARIVVDAEDRSQAVRIAHCAIDGERTIMFPMVSVVRVCKERTVGRMLFSETEERVVGNDRSISHWHQMDEGEYCHWTQIERIRHDDVDHWRIMIHNGRSRMAQWLPFSNANEHEFRLWYILREFERNFSRELNRIEARRDCIKTAALYY